MRPNVAKANTARRKDIRGQIFNRLTVVSYDEENKKWICSCECGGSALVKTAALNNGNTRSCGCYQRARASSVATDLHKTRRLSQGRDEDEKLSTLGVLERLEFKPLSREILERDGFSCVWCSRSGGVLNVHHIAPWARNPSRRFERTNLVTLCRPCHLKVHNGNYHAEVDHTMSILLEGYAKEIEVICMRVELT